MNGAMHRVIGALQKHGCRRSGVNWTCPAHDDRNPSLTVSEGSDGRVLLRCHAGCAPEAVIEALDLKMDDLFKSNGRGYSTEPLATYDYRDETGSLLFQVCRFEGKRFRQRRPDGRGDWVWNLKGVPRLIYRLPDLVENREATVFVVEGEKDADRLYELGITSTTNSGGAGKWREEHSERLRERDVVIVPDNDEAGCKHGREVAGSLHGVASTVRILRLPGLPGKGDVSDWLDNGGSPEELRTLALKAPVYDPDEEDADEGERRSEASREARQKESQANRLVECAQASGIELFHDQHGDPYAAIPDEHGRRILSVDSRDVSLWLRRLAWNELKTAPTGEVITTVRQTLASIARFDGEERALHVRCAWHGGSIWIDLDGHRAARVTTGAWEMVELPPILFRSFAHQKPLPTPVRGGGLRDCLRFLRIKDGKTETLFLSYLVAAMVPDIPVAALIVHGVQGATKTTLLKIVKRLLDPSAVEVRGGVRDQTEFAQAAAQGRVLFFDNLSSMPGWLSDALCRTVTGEGWSKRSLFTDTETTVLEYRGVVGLGGINVVADRADLLDRAVIISLDPVSPEERREERAFWADFEEARPRILGGMLDVLARAMEIEPGLELKSLPRMADFARWCAAAAVAMGGTAEDFLEAFGENVARQNEVAVEASPVAQAVIACMRERAEWEGTAHELLDRLESEAECLRINTKDRSWPKTANWLTRRIREVEPNLLAMGIDVRVDRTGEHRRLLLRKVAGNIVSDATCDTLFDPNGLEGDDSVTASIDTVTDAVIANSLFCKGPDGSDGNDGKPAYPCGTVNLSAFGVDTDALEERAAILEFEGGMPRAEAERQVREEMARRKG